MHSALIVVYRKSLMNTGDSRRDSLVTLHWQQTQTYSIAIYLMYTLTSGRLPIVTILERTEMNMQLFKFR